MANENGKKLQEIVGQAIAMVLLAAMAGGGASYLRPDAPVAKDPQIAVLQEQVHHLKEEMVIVETELARHRMDLGTLTGRVDMIGRLQLRGTGLP